MTNYRGLDIPFTRMGNVTSDDLFGPNEQVIFDFYEANRDRYRRALDVGANIGVHSILMARQGWEVSAYEPDPDHFDMLRQNLTSNGVSLQVGINNVAVSDRDGAAPFVRVLDNTTGSHLLGAKDHYGPTETFNVTTVDCRPLFEWADFVKMDCEGHEATVILALLPHIWLTTDALIEVGSEHNARSIYQHLTDVVPMWAQKTGWCQVRDWYDLPKHHSEGSLFIGREPPFW